MQSPSFHPSSFIGNIAALFVVAIAASYAFDVVAGLFGYRSTLVCAAFRPLAVLAETAAIALGTIGAIVFAFSGFCRFELLLGAFVIGVLPGLFLNYLGIACGG